MHDSGVWLGGAMVMVGWISQEVYSRIYEPPRARAYLASLRRINQRSRVRLHCHAYAITTEVGDEFLCLGLRVIPSKELPDGCSDLVDEDAPPFTVDYKYLPFDSGWSPAMGSDERLKGAVRAEVTGRAGALLAREMRELAPLLGSLTMGTPLDDCDVEVRRHLAADGALADGVVVCYTAGQCFRHRNYGYRGVIIGSSDYACMMDEEWIVQMGVDRLPLGRYQPWYHVLADTRDRPGTQKCCAPEAGISNQQTA
jgi:hemimethylated DNA binding protein